ncbi:MAG TPA: hemerythrin domain-containing protein [Vicinamibacterales bacterium]|nr:hemerythrin domain-containing protein [Vicinamibacterales bacterium]
MLESATAAVTGTVAVAVTTVAGKLPWAGSEPDAIALLEQDHRRFEDLLKRGEETTERAVKERREILRSLTDGLTVHELLEEKLLYPALESKSPTREIALEGFEEHHVADVILKELHRLPPASERWGAKFKVLKETLEHHIKEEERAMFRSARGVLSRDELQQLGARMEELRAKNSTRRAR